MPKPAYIELEGQRYLWRDLIALRREQLRQAATPAQPALFELIEDRKPPSEATGALRYLEPTLFTLLAGPRP